MQRRAHCSASSSGDSGKRAEEGCWARRKAGEITAIYNSTAVGIMSATPIMYRQAESLSSLDQHPWPTPTSLQSDTWARDVVGTLERGSSYSPRRRGWRHNTYEYMVFSSRSERLAILSYSIHNSYPLHNLSYRTQKINMLPR